MFYGEQEGLCLLIGGEAEVQWNGRRPKRREGVEDEWDVGT